MISSLLLVTEEAAAPAPTEFEIVLGTTTPSFTYDFTWTKDRINATTHVLSNTVLGDFYLSSAASTAEQATVPAVDSDDVTWGFNMPTDNASNTDGSITSSTKNNSFSSVVSYTGTGANATVGHSLGVVPELILVKNRIDVVPWLVYNATIGNTMYLILNDILAAATLASAWNNTSPTSSVFSVGTNGTVNDNNDGMIALCFASVAGKCKVGSYTGDGTTDDSNTVSCGFLPSFLMVRRTDDVGSWMMFDSVRDTDGRQDSYLIANTAGAEVVNSTLDIIFDSDGFTVSSTNSNINASGSTYIFLAIK